MTLNFKSFEEYLSEPCDEPGCDRTATHNQPRRQVCNVHLDDTVWARARND